MSVNSTTIICFLTVAIACFSFGYTKGSHDAWQAGAAIRARGSE